jgi:polysaccharide biosynthesis transport protein
VMIEPRKNNITDLSDIFSQLPTDTASVQNQIQILTSRSLAEKVVSQLGLDRDPEFNTALKPGLLTSLFGREPDPQEQHQAVVDRFLAHVSVNEIGLSTTLSVGFSSRDAQKATRIANALADAYVQDQVDIKYQTASRTAQWLLNRIAQLGSQVQAADAAVQRYKAENNLNDTAGEPSVADQQMIGINAQLVQARADLAAKRATDQRVRQMLNAGHAADVTQVVSSPVIAQLRQQEVQLIAQEADLATRYGPKHPKLQAIEAQKRDVESKIEQEAQRTAATAANDAAVSQAQVDSLSGSLKNAEQESTAQNMARVKLKALEANAASTESIYQAYVTRLRETQGVDGTQFADARVLSYAAVPQAPSSHKALLLAAAVPAGLLLGLLFALAAERAAPGDLGASRAFARLPILARIPLPQNALSHQKNLADLILTQPSSAFAKGVSLLRQRLVGGPRSTGARVVLVTSAVSGDGKTSLAVALARSASLAGLRVMLIDGNFRRPAIATTLHAAPSNGIVAALTGRLALSDCIFRDQSTGVQALACTQPLRDPSQLLASPALAQTLAKLREEFDLVVMDSAPVLTANDAALLARLSDILLLVTRHGRTEKTAIDVARQNLSASPVQLAAVSLTSSSWAGLLQK